MPPKNDPRQTATQYPSLRPIRVLHRNPWFTVRNRGGYFTVEYNAAQVAVLPVVDDRAIVLVLVKRPVINNAVWEIPAGGVNQHETTREAARRELLEEAGIIIQSLRRFRPLPPLVVSSSRNPVLPCLFYIHLSEQEFRKRQPHDAEIIRVECFTYAELKKKIARGEIYVSLPVAMISSFIWRREYRL